MWSNVNGTVTLFGGCVISCVVDKEAFKVTDIEFKDGDLVLIGNEGNGLSEDTKKISTF